jgi:hypothetical protein
MVHVVVQTVNSVRSQLLYKLLKMSVGQMDTKYGDILLHTKNTTVE